MTAYGMLIDEINSSESNKKIIALSKILSKEVRRKARRLGSSKATEMSKETFETEALLRLVIKINGEGIHDRINDK